MRKCKCHGLPMASSGGLRCRVKLAAKSRRSYYKHRDKNVARVRDWQSRNWMKVETYELKRQHERRERRLDELHAKN